MHMSEKILIAGGSGLIGTRLSEILIEEGYDPLYGARPLKRTLQKRVLDPLAMAMLQGEFREGDDVSLDVVDGGLSFEKRPTVVH